MISRIKYSIFLISLSLFFPSKIFAAVASINLTEPSTNSITDINQEYQVKVDLSISSSDGTNYYLRGVFYQQGSTNYCGYTWNGSSWFSGPYSSGEGWKNFLAVTISSSSASTILKAKLDPDDNDCKNSGTYNFKVERFTENGSPNFDNQNEQTIVVTLPTPTSTPIPTTAPTSAPQPSSTPKPPTATPVPTANLSKSPTPTKVSISPKVYGESNLLKSQGGSILAAEDTKNTPSLIPKAPDEKVKGDHLAKVLIGLGGVMILGAAAWIGILIKKQKEVLDPHS